MLTRKSIARLQPRQHAYDVQEPGGLALRVLPSGKMSWCYLGRVRGRRIRRTLGNYPALAPGEARALARAEALAIDRLPLGPDLTLAELLERRPATTAAERTYAQHINRILGSASLRTLDRRQVSELSTYLTRRGITTGSNRTLPYLHRVLGWGVRHGLLESNPATGLTRPHKEIPRDRVLSDAEIGTLLGALDDRRQHRAIALALSTVQRS